jgi:hypothetical protein
MGPPAPRTKLVWVLRLGVVARVPVVGKEGRWQGLSPSRTIPRDLILMMAEAFHAATPLPSRR